MLLTDEYQRLPAAAKALGLSPQTLRDAIARRDLPGYQPNGRGGAVFVKPSEVREWVERGRIGAGA